MSAHWLPGRPLTSTISLLVALFAAAGLTVQCAPAPAAVPPSPAPTQVAAPPATQAAAATQPAASAATQAPASTQPAAQPSGEKVTLTIWYWGEQEAPGLKAYMEEAAKIYTQEHPNIQVKTALQGEDLRVAFRAAANAKQGPDIQYFWGGVWTLEDAWLGNLVPISDYWTPDEINHLPVGQRAETFWDGKQWGVPFYQIGTFFAYNKKLFTKAGLDPAKPPVTWDEFTAACEKLKAAGITPIGMGLKDGQFGGWLISYFGQQNLDSINDLLAGIRGEQNFTDSKHAEWWMRLDELVKKGYFNKDVMSLDGYQGQALLESGDAAMAMHVEPYIVQLERKMGKDTIGVMRAPIYGKGKQAQSVGVPVQTLAITSFSPHKQEAADYLRFMHTSRMMKMQYEMAGAITPDDRFDASWLTTDADQQIAKWAKEYPLFWYQYYYPPELETEGAIPGSQLIANGEITPQEAAKRYQDVADKWRKQSPDQLKAYTKWTLPPEMFGSK